MVSREIHLSSGLNIDLLVIEEVVDSVILILFYGRECVHGFSASVSLDVENPVGTSNSGKVDHFQIQI